jgi:hypothetical protein
MCLHVSRLFWVSSLAYPNLLGTKGYVVVVVVDDDDDAHTHLYKYTHTNPTNEILTYRYIKPQDQRFPTEETPDQLLKDRSGAWGLYPSGTLACTLMP